MAIEIRYVTLRDVFFDRAVYRIFDKGGRTWSMSKRGGARLFVAARQPQGGGGIQGRARITQGGEIPPPPLNTPLTPSIATFFSKGSRLGRSMSTNLPLTFTSIIFLQ